MGRPKPPADFSPLSVAPVTAKSLKALFEERGIVRGIRRSDKLPSRKGFAELASSINAIRFRKFLGDLSRDIPRQPIRVMPDAPPCPEALEAAERAFRVSWHQSLKAAEAVAGRNGPTPPFPKEWHEFAPWLADRFRAAMRTTNPGLEIGWSNDNALTRFLAAVIPLITGETPKPSGVGGYLQRMRQWRIRHPCCG